MDEHSIKRRGDGSIDIATYLDRSHAMRSDWFFQQLQRFRRWLAGSPAQVGQDTCRSQSLEKKTPNRRARHDGALRTSGDQRPGAY